MVLVPLVQSSKINTMKKKKEPNLFLREKPLEDIKYLGVGFFEWFAVLGALGLILGSILKNI